jgi:hypothetical protein
MSKETLLAADCAADGRYAFLLVAPPPFSSCGVRVARMSYSIT